MIYLGISVTIIIIQYFIDTILNALNGDWTRYWIPEAIKVRSWWSTSRFLVSRTNKYTKISFSFSSIWNMNILFRKTRILCGRNFQFVQMKKLELCMRLNLNKRMSIWIIHNKIVNIRNFCKFLLQQKSESLEIRIYMEGWSLNWTCWSELI